MSDEAWTWASGSLSLWAFSAALAVALGFLYALGTGHKASRPLASAAIHLTRGIPTSLLVVFGGMACLRVPNPPRLPVIFPGTSPEFQFCAWGIVLALALGSSGHLAVIFRTAWESGGRRHLEQARVLGLTTRGQLQLAGREVLPQAIGATGPRLVHHLHNTAFAALFPVVDAFGGVVEQANETFEVGRAVALGAVIYIVMSQTIWLMTRALESWLRPPVPTQERHKERVGAAA